MDFKVILNEQTPEVSPLKDVGSFFNEKKEELKAFLEFAKLKDTAVGLAANQVSLNGDRFMCRCFAIKNIVMGPDGSLQSDNTWKLIIDPVITEKYGIKIEKSEGCLTWPNKKVISERNRFIKVNYYVVDDAFESITKVENEEHEGFDAQIWQHEINHLNGFVEQVKDKSFTLSVKEPQRNDKCPCGSDKKYKTCCHSYVNPKIVYSRRPSFDEALASGGKL